jgi:hypothetical protein
MKFGNRLKKLERACLPELSGFLVAFTRAEAADVVAQFRKRNPRASTPTVLVVTPVSKPKNAGLGG